MLKRLNQSAIQIKSLTHRCRYLTTSSTRPNFFGFEDSKMSKNTLNPASDHPSFPLEEANVLAYWREIDAFQESNRRAAKENRPIFSFYDGPPFATGLPHYGNLLAGTIKDVVTRYAYQTGHQVERRFGWDCHGLPVEYEIDQKLNISGRQDVLKMGIDKYNEECRAIVQRYSSEWRSIVERMGRWIDFDRDYKTMDRSFMESVWWVFKEMHSKGLVYRDSKVMPFSCACGTPLSNFEAGLNYKEVSDPSIIVAFPTVEDPNVLLLAWTTTPWTLPSNLAVCVHPDFEYVYVGVNIKASEELANTHQSDKIWVLAKNRLQWLCDTLGISSEHDVRILSTKKGSDLKDIRFIPMFDYFNAPPWSDVAFRVLVDSYVTDDSGTGIVQQAPAFGEDDHRIAAASGITTRDRQPPCPLDTAGCFTNECPDICGAYVKSADKILKNKIKEKNRLLHSSVMVHSYPMCWRSDQPLIYRTVPSWFVAVEKIKEKLLVNNANTYWVPSAIKEKRFHNWLVDSRDWCVSRSRYWGTPLPLWVSEDFKEIKCIGSVAELEACAGHPLPDIHRHFIDHITIPDPRGEGYPPLRRVDEVFDCWFESGSMPYGQKHYPFENKEEFTSSFPADFIAEGLDQTRGWFYTLLIIGTALFDTAPWKNVVVNGLVLAADKKKMSKRLKNYPDPQLMIDTHGADALRLYLINSPVVRAEPLRFVEAGLQSVVRDVFLPWYHAYRFLVQEVGRFEETTGKPFQADTELLRKSFSSVKSVPTDSTVNVGCGVNIMDRWIYGSLHELIKFIKSEMQLYHLYTVIPRLVDFLENLTNWYVRLNRDRMRGSEALAPLQVLYEVMLTSSEVMAPFTPFTSEMIYSNLKRALPNGHPRLNSSVHFNSFPSHDSLFIDEGIEQAVKNMQSVIVIGRAMRQKRKVGLKTPLSSMRVIHSQKKLYRRHQETGELH
eukprot:GHVN01055109.1.p1 GENE.GHVN01055109.1~~GHVN01055109.1.p1  ORF type:complete len:946 (-),score=156.39 GHVN01055109.1:1126-3963(-)